MAEIIPFKSVRPTRDKAHLVASRSYITYKPKQLSRKLNENPFSFIHIINPDYGEKEISPALSDERFEKVKAKYNEFVDHGYLCKEETANFYIYRQITPTATFTGIICGVQVQEYLDGQIKVHEQTITSRVEVFTKYLDVCDFNAEPVLLTYKGEGANLKHTIEANTQVRSEYDFSTSDRVRHQLWPISDQGEIEKIQEAFDKIDCLYIADGHHRMASSANLGKNRKERDSNWHHDDICNFALALIIPESTLSIQSFHRVITLAEPLVEENLFNALALVYDIEKCDEAYIPAANHHFGMRIASGWYALTLKNAVTAKTAVEQIDPMVLTQTILEPIFGIEDQKTDDRIHFVPENYKLAKLEKKIDNKRLSVVFTLFPVSTQELFDVADANEIMPPKSTYIEPKLRSGLTIMNLS